MTSPRLRGTAHVLVALSVGLGLSVLASPAAHAVGGPRLTNTGGVVTVTGQTSALDLYLAPSTDHAGYLTLGSDTGWTSVAGCEFLYGGTTYVDCPGVTRIVVNGGAGNDYVGASDQLGLPMEVHAGAGDDDINTGTGNDRVFGDAGRDYVAGDAGDDLVDGGDGDDYQVRGDEGRDTVTGGAGNDRVMGNAHGDTVSGGLGDDEVYGDSGGSFFLADDGNDTLNGDAGDDLLYPAGGNDVVNGGTHEDTATYDGFQEDGVAFRASLDRVANDGPIGDNDNVGPLGDVENLTSPDYTGVGAVTLRGDAGPNVLTVSASDGDVEVDGLAGDDEIVTYFIFGDSAHLDGGPGNDEITDFAEVDGTTILGGEGSDAIDGRYGDEAIDGGAGNDSIKGGFGNDTITGGPGTDSIEAEAGNDIVEAVDQTLDTVSCGADADIARVDANDVVAVDIINLCESLTKVQPPKPNVAVPTKSRYRLNARGAATFSLTNNSDFAVNGTATAKTTKKVGAGSVTLAAEARGKLGLKLTRAARATVRKKGSLRATVTFVFKGNGQTTTVKRTVKFLKP